MSDNATPNAKLSIDGGMPDRMHHQSQRSSPSNLTLPVEVRRVGRQASSAGWLSSNNGMNAAIAKRFVLNQRVNVNIEGRGWLIGTVVAFMTVVKNLTGSGVQVKYFAPYDSRESTTIVPNDPSFIRPIEADNQSRAVLGR